MEALALHASVQNQQAAAHWHDKAMHWHMVARWPVGETRRQLAELFATQYQQDAARLYAADRRLRLVEDGDVCAVHASTFSASSAERIKPNPTRQVEV